MTASESLGTVERSETLTLQTYRKLRQALMSGRLKPGEKVTGRQIAAALDVSLTPAREAISRLVAEGGLEPGMNRAALVPRLTRSKYREIISIRLLLEGLAAETAAAHMDDARLAELVRIQEAMEAAADSGDQVARMQRNADFHFFIYRAAELPTLFAIIDGLWLQAGPTLSLLAPDYQQSRKGSRHHFDAIAAARAKDGAGLRRAIEEDIEDGTAYILPLLQES